MRPHLYLLLVAVFASVLFVLGLNGPFLFDDNIHISQNQWVKIDSLTPNALIQAWKSSSSAFPANRPLAQLSFGINHAFAGLDPWAYKATNLVIHILTGLTIFVFTRLVFRAVHGTEANSKRELGFAIVTMAVWLLHPLHVSTVLYTVQRMTQLSAMFVMLALSSYLRGRLRLANNKPGFSWLLLTPVIALIGFLGKENAALLPLFLLVLEITVLRGVSPGANPSRLRYIQIAFIAVPLLLGTIYFFTHPGLINYDQRPFTLEERVLTQPRVLWFYLRLLFIPDISQFGLFHDDIAISTGLLSPPSTALAITGLIIMIGGAWVLRRRHPILSFGVLFFFAGHILESSVLALEMVFEHRNYLPSLGPLMALAYAVTIGTERLQARRLALGVGAALLVAYAAATFVRVNNWSSFQSFVLSSANNHPDSPRANFAAGQFMIGAIENSGSAKPKIEQSARHFLQQGLAAEPQCLNCMFGLLVLDLYLNQTPAAQNLERLTQALKTEYVGPTRVSVSQFGFLVDWQKAGSSSMTNQQLESLLDAALANPRWGYTGRSAIEGAYREYHEFVTKDLEAALQHGKAAANAWAEQWKPRMRVVRILLKLGRQEEALTQLDVAASVARNPQQIEETEQVRKHIYDALGR